MCNLGDYQTMTQLANKVGGPKTLAALLIGGGIIIGFALAYRYLKNNCVYTYTRNDEEEIANG